MNELAVIDQTELDTALARLESLSNLLASETTHENAQAKKDASLELSKIAKLLESKRADAVKPALEEQRRINGIFKPVLEKLENTSRGLILQVQKFANDEARKEQARRAELARIEAEKLLAGEPIVAIDSSYGKDQTSVQQLPTVSETKVWTYEIVDALAVPRQFLSVDEKKIMDSIKAGARSIPGVKIFQETRVGRR